MAKEGFTFLETTSPLSRYRYFSRFVYAHITLCALEEMSYIQASISEDGRVRLELRVPNRKPRMLWALQYPLQSKRERALGGFRK